MAVNLNSRSETRENINKQIERETAIKFKIFDALCVLVALAMVITGGIGIKRHYDNVQDLQAQYDKLNADYASLKSEAAAWHEENDAKRDDAGVRTETKQMYSAQEGGQELADLMNVYFKDGGLGTEAKSRLSVLTGSPNVNPWYGGKLDPHATPIVWQFDTFYDAQVPTYDCLWSCWYTKGSGTKYLIALKLGSYNGETGKFAVDSNTYYSQFAYMLDQNGAIEADPNSSTIDPDLQDMIDDLIPGLTGDESVPANDGSPSENNSDIIQDTTGSTEGVTDPEMPTDQQIADSEAEQPPVETEPEEPESNIASPAR